MNAPIHQSVLAARQPENSAVTMGFGSLQSFEFMQRTAKMFSSSSMVPTAYRSQTLVKGKDENGNWTEEWRENPSALPNCMIALNMSQRMNADPLMIMQNLHVIEGRPSWSSQFIIAAINSSGRYSPLRFDIVEGEEIQALSTTYQGWGKDKKCIESFTTVKNTSCVAWAVELSTNTRLESPVVTIEMAVNEGWYGKNGSKWKTMPELMLRYRSAAFFGRIYAPELLMGLSSAEESHDIITLAEQPDGVYAVDVMPASTQQAAQRSDIKTSANDAVANADYPSDKFEKGLEGWLKLIASGQKTADQLIATLQSKNPLTDAQKAALRATPAVSSLADPDGVIVMTFAQVASKLHAAKDVDALHTAASLIDAVTDIEQQAELGVIYDAALQKLTA